MLFVPIFALLVQAFAVQANMFGRMHEKGADDVKALCKGKKFNLSTFAQLKQLAGKLNLQCGHETNQTVAKLLEIYEHNKEDLCTMSHASDLKKFYGWGLSTFLYPISGDDEPTRSVSLKRLAIAYGLQVSNMCKRNMLEALTGNEGRRKLAGMSAGARKLFEQLTNDGGPVGHVLGDLGNRAELIEPGDLLAYLKLLGHSRIPILRPAMSVRYATLNYIEKARLQCERTFRRVYEPYMKPLIELANMGLSYRGQELMSKLEDPATAKELGRWARIAYACATFEQSEFRKKSVVSDSTVTVQVDSRYAMTIQCGPATKVTLGEQTTIFDKSDKRLVSAVKSAYISPDDSHLASRRLAWMTSETMARGLEPGRVGKTVVDAQRDSLDSLQAEQCSDTGHFIEAIDEMIE